MLFPAFKSPEWQRIVLRLYRDVLRLHAQKLLPAQRALGDSYVKHEFKLNKVANKQQSHEFVEQWTEYMEQLRMIPDPVQFGRDMPSDMLGGLSDEQKEQLAKLKDEAVAFKQQLYESQQQQFRQQSDA